MRTQINVQSVWESLVTLIVNGKLIVKEKLRSVNYMFRVYLVILYLSICQSFKSFHVEVKKTFILSSFKIVSYLYESVLWFLWIHLVRKS